MEEKREDDKNLENDALKFFGIRHLQLFLMFLAVFLTYGTRSNVSVAVIAMTEEKPPYPDIPTYPEWHNSNIIISSFYWAYVISLIIAGQLIQKFGSKWFLVVAMTIGSILHLLIPEAARLWGSTGVIIFRLFGGANQGFVYPSAHYLMTKWCPPQERARFAAFVYGGAILGVFASSTFTGFISATQWGWPASYYVIGGLGVVWAIVWGAIGCDEPLKHTRISEKELAYIRESSDHETKIPTPWKSILTSMPMWAILLSQISHAWVFWIVLNEIPLYLKKIMDFDIEENGLLSSLPHITSWLFSMITAPIVDIITIKQYFRRITIRKFSQCTGALIPGLCLVWLGLLDGNNPNLAVTLLFVMSIFATLCSTGYLINHMEIAPNFAAVLFGFTTSISNGGTILAPILIELTGLAEDDPIMWRIVFWVSAALEIISLIVFALFASTDKQSWNNDDAQKMEIPSSNPCVTPEDVVTINFLG